MWGVHPLDRRVDFVREGVIALERPGVGDLRRIGDDRAHIKAVLVATYPREKERTIQQWAGTLIRFAFAANAGDLVLHPDPVARTLHFGRLVGDYYWHDGAPNDRHCRKVSWTHTHVPRGRFTADAQKDASGRAAFFAVDRYRTEFETFLDEQGSRDATR